MDNGIQTTEQVRADIGIVLGRGARVAEPNRDMAINHLLVALDGAGSPACTLLSTSSVLYIGRCYIYRNNY